MSSARAWRRSACRTGSKQLALRRLVASAPAGQPADRICTPRTGRLASNFGSACVWLPKDDQSPCSRRASQSHVRSAQRLHSRCHPPWRPEPATERANPPSLPWIARRLRGSSQSTRATGEAEPQATRITGNTGTGGIPRTCLWRETHLCRIRPAADAGAHLCHGYALPPTWRTAASSTEGATGCASPPSSQNGVRPSSVGRNHAREHPRQACS